VADVNVSANGGGGGSAPDADVQLFCVPSNGKKVGVGDQCNGFYGVVGVNAHLVACTSSVAIP